MVSPVSNKMELKKHVNTIHCSNALTLVERQLYNALLYHAYGDLLTKREHQVPIAHLKELIGYGSRDYRKLKKYLKGLMGKVLEWNVIDSDDSEAWVGSTILASAEIKNNICTYQYSDKMSQLLHRPEIYGKLDLLHIAKFRSKFGLALYENCMRYQNISNTSWMSVEVFRKLMGVLDGKFSRFCDFKKYVIEVAVKEVNDISPINVSPKYKKIGKSVTEVKFVITKTAKLQPVQEGSSALAKTLSEQFNFSLEYIENLCTKYSEEYIQEKLNVILNSNPYKKGDIKSLSGYLVEALEKNYQPNVTSTKHNMHKKEKKEAVIKAHNKIEERHSKRYKHYVDSNVKIYLESLSSDKYNELLSDFRATVIASNNHMLEKYINSHGIEHALTEVAFKRYVCERINKTQSGIQNYNDFKASLSAPSDLDQTLAETST